MLSTARQVSEHHFPDVNAPAREEWQVLRQWRETLERALNGVFTRLTENTATVLMAEPRITGEALHFSDYQARIAQGRQRGWWLLLPTDTETLLVAAALQVKYLTLGVRGAVGYSLQELLWRELLLAAWTATNSDRTNVPEIITHKDDSHFPTPWLSFALLFKVGAATAEGLLVGGWRDWQPLCINPHHKEKHSLELKTLYGASVELEAILPGSCISAREALELRPGDVIPLGPATQEVALRLYGSVLGSGRAGAQGRNLAVSVSKAELTREGELDGP